jgi:hypothetical protein
MSVAKLEPAVLHQLDLAIAQREPQVAAVIEGDNRHTDALASVEEAKAALAEYRDNIELQQVLGVSDFIAGLRTRKEAVETARRALRNVPRPEPVGSRKMTLEEFDLADRRHFYQRVIAEVLVFPRSEPQRLRLRWQGAENSIVVPPFKPVNLAHADPITELQKAAAKGDRDAKRYLAAKKVVPGGAEESLLEAALPDTRPGFRLGDLRGRFCGGGAGGVSRGHGRRSFAAERLQGQRLRRRHRVRALEGRRVQGI